MKFFLIFIFVVFICFSASHIRYSHASDTCESVSTEVFATAVDIIARQEALYRSLSQEAALAIARKVFVPQARIHIGAYQPTRCDVLHQTTLNFEDPDDLKVMLWIIAGESAFNPAEEAITPRKYSCGPTQINLDYHVSTTEKHLGSSGHSEEYLCQKLKADPALALRVSYDLYTHDGPAIWSAFRGIDQQFINSL